MTEPFDALTDEHEEFAELLLSHQAALVRGDLDAGRELIARLQATLVRHIAVEETELLPVLEERGKWTRVGEPRYYREEHEKIRATVAALVDATDALDANGTAIHREIALLIGREQSFRTLLEHHDDRERRALFPDLIAVTTVEERARMVAALT